MRIHPTWKSVMTIIETKEHRCCRLAGKQLCVPSKHPTFLTAPEFSTPMKARCIGAAVHNGRPGSNSGLTHTFIKAEKARDRIKHGCSNSTF
jgi:hypothetical protein